MRFQLKPANPCHLNMSMYPTHVYLIQIFQGRPFLAKRVKIKIAFVEENGIIYVKNVL